MSIEHFDMSLKIVIFVDHFLDINDFCVISTENIAIFNARLVDIDTHFDFIH